jgi:hypothetical protein
MTPAASNQPNNLNLRVMTGTAENFFHKTQIVIRLSLTWIKRRSAHPCAYGAPSICRPIRAIAC